MIRILAVIAALLCVAPAAIAQPLGDRDGRLAVRIHFIPFREFFGVGLVIRADIGDLHPDRPVI